ncbi:MAG: ABC transporter ATP-binding protein [Thermoanaerobaculaceae bacterium]
MAYLEVQGLSKAFGSVQAVSDLSFSVPKGFIFGLLGPNGAGKTTTIRMIMRIVLPDAGTVLLEGEPIDEERRKLLGYLPEERGLYRKMKVLEHLTFLGEVRGLPREEALRRARDWLDRLGLSGKAQAKVEALSKGMQQKVQFAAALIHDPPLVILDEPFTGLDPIATRQFKDEMLALRKRGVTVLFSTHVLPQAEELCDGYCLINKGRTVFSGSAEALKIRYGSILVKLTTADDGRALPSPLPGVLSMSQKQGAYLLQLAENVTVPQLVRLLAPTVDLTSVEMYQPSLEEIFLRAVEEDAGEASHVSLA